MDRCCRDPPEECYTESDCIYDEPKPPRKVETKDTTEKNEKEGTLIEDPTQSTAGNKAPHYEHVLFPAGVKKEITSPIPSISTIDCSTEMNETTPLTSEYYDTLDSPAYVPLMGQFQLKLIEDHTNEDMLRTDLMEEWRT